MSATETEKRRIRGYVSQLRLAVSASRDGAYATLDLTTARELLRILLEYEKRVEELEQKNDNLSQLAAEEHALAVSVALWSSRKMQAMHRRAQKSEGKLARTANILKSVVGAIERPEGVYPVGRWWVVSAIRAALGHARAGSGVAMSVEYAHWAPTIRELDEKNQRLTKILEQAYDELSRARPGCQLCETMARELGRVRD